MVYCAVFELLEILMIRIIHDCLQPGDKTMMFVNTECGHIQGHFTWNPNYNQKSLEEKMKSCLHCKIVCINFFEVETAISFISKRKKKLDYIPV